MINPQVEKKLATAAEQHLGMLTDYGVIDRASRLMARTFIEGGKWGIENPRAGFDGWDAKDLAKIIWAATTDNQPSSWFRARPATQDRYTDIAERALRWIEEKARARALDLNAVMADVITVRESR